MFCFCFNIAKRPLWKIHAQDCNRNQSLLAFAQRNSFVSVFNKVENTLLLNFYLPTCAVFDILRIECWSCQGRNQEGANWAIAPPPKFLKQFLCMPLRCVI